MELFNGRFCTDNGTNIISATRSDEEFLCALEAAPRIIFDLSPDIMNINAKTKRAHAAEKKLFIHIDLAKGIGKDESALRYLVRLGIDGVISTKTNVIKTARELGLLTVQRFFIVDSRSIISAEEAFKSSHPDMIEVMPGTVCKVIRTLGTVTDIPIIAGGLIESEREVAEAIKNGAAAVSTGKRELWK